MNFLVVIQFLSKYWKSWEFLISFFVISKQYSCLSLGYEGSCKTTQNLGFVLKKVDWTELEVELDCPIEKTKSDPLLFVVILLL